MSNRPDPIDPFTAERLLRGEPASADQVPDRLAGLLAAAAAAAPAEAGELAGEDAAVAAFREARLAPAPRLRRLSMLKATLAKYITVKVGAVALIATTTTAGGVALAAGGDHLPTALGGGKPTAHPKPTHRPGTPGPGKDGKHNGPGQTAKPGQPGHGKPGAAADPALKGLCQAYKSHVVHGADGKPGKQDKASKLLDTPAFARLVSAAGGKDKVAPFCAALLDDRKDKAGPTPAPKNPQARPSGGPGARPGNAATPKPGGQERKSR